MSVNRPRINDQSANGEDYTVHTNTHKKKGETMSQIRNKMSLAQQIKIEESFKEDIDNGVREERFCHYLTTHPEAYREFKEIDEDLRRFNF